MSTKVVDYSSYAVISRCACVTYYLMYTRWLLSVRALLVGVVLAQERRLFCWKYFEKVCTVNSSKEKTKFKVSCKFCTEELAYHGATSAMREHLKHKHPIETEGDQPRTRIWT